MRDLAVQLVPTLFAVHIDGLIFLLLLGVAGLFRMLSKKASDLREDDDSSLPTRRQLPPALPREGTQGDEERIRKFLEALGQPATSRPPPPVKPRAIPPSLSEFQRKQIEAAARSARRRNILNPVPPLTTAPPDLPRRVTLPRPITQPTYEASILLPEPPPLAVAEPAISAAPVSGLLDSSPIEPYAVPLSAKPERSNAAIDLSSLFASRDDLRRAIILREILGPPRSLRPLEDLSAVA